jgi:hypothetical protein
LNLPTGTNTVQLASQYGADGVFLDKFTVTYIGPFSALNTVNADNSIEFYPSLVREQAKIHFAQSLQHKSTLMIFNIKGEKVREIPLATGTTDFTFNRNGLASGVYLLQLRNSTEVSSIRFVVE